MMSRLKIWRILVFICAYHTIFSTAWAQEAPQQPQEPKAPVIILNGTIGKSAILSIDGTPQKTMTVGQTYRGIKLLSVQGQNAVILITDENGKPKRVTLRVGAAPFLLNNASERTSNTSSPSCNAGTQIITANAAGMFFTLGYINGRGVNFVIDTGATAVSMDERQARALGITNYKQGRAIQLNTANGVATGYLITLASVRIGTIEVKNVEAAVGGDQNILLLGNSFLKHVDIEMTSKEIILRKRCP